MARFLHHVFQHTHRRMYRFPIALCFTFGLLVGGFLFRRADISFLHMMYRAMTSRVTIVGLAAVSFLPFLISAFAVSFRRFRLLPLIAFVKALLFSYVMLGIMAAYGNGSWLACLLLMFSDILSLPVLLLYWLRQSREAEQSQDLLFLSLLIFIGSMDNFIVSPIAASL